MITSDRDVFIGAHLTLPQKERFKLEAAKRKLSMSALVAKIIGDWLQTATKEKIEPIRSNKRDLKTVCPNDPYKGKRPDQPCSCDVCVALRKEIDEPLPFED